MDYVLLPIHQSGNHWTTAVIDMKNKHIDYYDSLLGNNPKCFLVCDNCLVLCEGGGTHGLSKEELVTLTPIDCATKNIRF